MLILFEQMYEAWYVERAPLDVVPWCSAQSAQLCIGAL